MIITFGTLANEVIFIGKMDQFPVSLHRVFFHERLLTQVATNAFGPVITPEMLTQRSGLSVADRTVHHLERLFGVTKSHVIYGLVVVQSRLTMTAVAKMNQTQIFLRVSIETAGAASTLRGFQPDRLLNARTERHSKVKFALTHF